jgi:ATP-dependent Clp protease ATP-binding subunit ClpC
LIKRINELGYEIEISETAKDFISEKGFDSKYGARPLNRAIQKYLEDLLAENVVNNSIKEGDKVFIDKNKGDDFLNLKINQEIENS